MDQPRGKVEELLHHGADALALGTVTRRGVRAEQTALPDPAQDVVGELREGEDQCVGGELPRGQAIDVEVSLEFAVVTLAGGVVSVRAMIVSSSNHRLVHQPSISMSGTSSCCPRLSLHRSRRPSRHAIVSG